MSRSNDPVEYCLLANHGLLVLRHELDVTGQADEHALCVVDCAIDLIGVTLVDGEAKKE